MNSDAVYQEMLNNMFEGIYFVDTERKITFWNKGAERISGFSRSEVNGHYCFNNILNHVDDSGNQLCLGGCPLHRTIEDGQTREATVYLHHRLGHRVPITVKTTPIIQDKKIIGAVEIFSDDAEKHLVRRQLEHLEMLAYRDELTGLANRRYVESSIRQKIMEFGELDLNFGLAFLDIDHFKNFNDSYGHALGDDILKLVSANLECLTLGAEVAGRWGGEEFVLVLNSRDKSSLDAQAERVRMLIEQSGLRSQGKTLRVTVSIGATLAEKEDCLDSIVARADKLMYLSKERGRNRVSIG